MSSVNITLPDGAVREVQQGVKLVDIAKDIHKKLAKSALAAKWNDKLVDMDTTATTDGTLAFYTPDTEEGLDVQRHTTAHVLAMAVQKLWPGTQVTIGPVIKDGFYYDFAFPKDVTLSEKDLPAIEKEMARIVKQNIPVTHEELSRDEMIAKFRALGEDYKVKIIEDLPADEPLTLYAMGDWADLCRGPHVPNTNKLGAFKLTKVAGAYWRGDEKEAMLTRIYGTAWATREELDLYLHRLEEAKKRDHRVLGKKLDLFSFHPESPANPFFHPKGAFIYNQLKEVARASNDAYGFQEVSTPLVMNVEMWHKSGHYDNYAEDMFFIETDDMQAAVKPMNCPGHCMIFKSNHHSYKDLPVKLSEFGRVHRNERSGVTHGLFRVRGFVQDDAHVFCTAEQIEEQVSLVIDQIIATYKTLGFPNVSMELSTRPEKSIGSDEIWERSEQALADVLKAGGHDYQLNPGDGAFYGPKIDFHLIDTLGRSWQCGTVQLDFSMPGRFDLEYISQDDEKTTPVMIHRAVLGSLERFMGIFIEQYAGHFPLWACPVQVQLVNVSQAQESYCREVAKALKAHGVRVELDLRNEKLGFKIREAQLQKIPFMIVVGDKEVESQQISPRKSDGSQWEPQSVDDFVAAIRADLELPHFPKVVSSS